MTAYVFYERDVPKGVFYSLEEAAEHLGVKYQTVVFMASPVHKQRIDSSKGRIIERVVLDD